MVQSSKVFRPGRSLRSAHGRAGRWLAAGALGAIAAALWLFSSAEDPQVGAHPALVAANGDPMATDGAGPDFAAPPSIDPSERIAGEIAIPSIAPPVLPPLPRGHLRIRAIDARSGLPVAGEVS